VPGLVALDLETTGLNVVTARIVEFCLVDLDADLNERGRLVRRVNPGVAIPPDAMARHGIRDEDVRNQPPFAFFAARIGKLVSNRVPIGYNVNFDLNVLHWELRRAGLRGLPTHHPRLDVLKLYRQLVPDHYTLGGAVRHFLGRPHTSAHTAQGDVLATVDILREQSRVSGAVANKIRELADAETIG
jgi:DNA polymerase III subunit epsilon